MLIIKEKTLKTVISCIKLSVEIAKIQKDYLLEDKYEKCMKAMIQYFNFYYK